MKKKERLQYPNASDVFIKKNVKGMEKLGGKGNAKKGAGPARLKMNTDETLKKYAGSFAKEAASPSAKTNPDSMLKADTTKDKTRSRGLNQKKYKGKK